MTRSVRALADLSRLEILPQSSFLEMLSRENKRTERTGFAFILILIERSGIPGPIDKHFERVISALAFSNRSTDIKGWYRQGSILGMIFLDIVTASAESTSLSLQKKVRSALSNTLGMSEVDEFHVSSHVFPQDWREQHGLDLVGSIAPCEPLEERKVSRRDLFLKRALDIAGSLLAIVMMAPLFVLLAVGIKLTTRGPIFFRQKRVGQHGRIFEFLKFRSMKEGNDAVIHREFIEELIKAGSSDPLKEHPVYKLTSDPRVTALGGFMRRTSLDELPQFFSVLRGDMSLVGPRPAIPYEVECYDLWHRRRFLSMKPGITGLWQVEGRSRTTFDDMVRLDLRYVTSWTIWIDLKILLRTPRALVSGAGAY